MEEFERIRPNVPVARSFTGEAEDGCASFSFDLSLSITSHALGGKLLR